ncbi:MAG TPA: zinc-dependent metalloprotease [Acidimicrobiales bacterium]|jgi:putative hydrolase|nr:zinc-dependent metalloprotease [Acidimicrobiales bacterium]
MAPTESGDAANPFQSLLGDLMNMLGTNAPDQWEMTRSFGVNVATGGTPEPNVEPIERIGLEELARVAELHVIEATGMPVSHDGRRLNYLPVGRGDWTIRALDAWKPVLSAMAPSAATPPPAAAADPDGPAEDDPFGGLGDLLGKWAVVIGPMFFGLQLGSVVGHLSHRALGQYALALPWAPSDELLIVTRNVTSFAEDWSIPNDEALLWVCAREVASHAVLSRPEVRGRMEELLLALAASASTSQQGLADRLGGLGDPSGGAGMDLESIQNMFGDPEALLGDLLTPEFRRSSDQLTALAVVIDAYADHIADLVGQKLVGSHAQLAEAWYRRRIERGKGEEAAGALFGLDLEQSQVDRGRSFIAGVVERAGEEALGRLWSSPRNLPTPPEVDAPGLWLERISLPELDPPDPAPEP